jgi:tape measure domain-containing protein
MTRFAEAFVSIGADVNQSSFGAVRQKIMRQVSSIGESASASLSASFGKAASGFVAILAALKGAEMVKFGLSLAAEAEQAQVAFETMLGSASQARKVLEDLKTFAAETPFEFPELRDAARKLIAFGVSADDVTATLRRIGDISSGVGAPIGELAELYGKAKVQGRMFAEDINQLTGRGIPIIQALAAQFGVAESEVRKLVESGKVGFPNIERAFRDMTSEGGRFASMMAKQSSTISGLWSTLTDALKTQLSKAGEAMISAFNLKAIVGGLTAVIEKADYLAKVVLTIADEGDFLHDMFLYGQAAAIRFFAAIAEGIANVVARISELFDKMPRNVLNAIGAGGVQEWAKSQAESARTFADSMSDSMNAAFDKANKAFIDKTPSERFRELKESLNSVADSAKKAGDAMGKMELPPKLKASIDEFATKQIQLANSIRKETRTPAEEYQAKMAELDKLLKNKDISPETYERAKAAEQDKAKRAAGIEATPNEALGRRMLDLMGLKEAGVINDATYERARAEAEKEANRKLGVDQPGESGESPRKSAPGFVGLAESVQQVQLAVLGGSRDPAQQRMLTQAQETAKATAATRDAIVRMMTNGLKVLSGPARAGG